MTAVNLYPIFQIEYRLNESYRIQRFTVRARDLQEAKARLQDSLYDGGYDKIWWLVSSKRLNKFPNPRKVRK